MFALVDVNSFYASCERVFHPALADRPVVVLSNNDGCIIARSQLAKQAGIEMGTPYFKALPLLKQHHVVVFSSNYTLYDDMSRRVQSVLRRLAPRVEVYSIDESFLVWKDAQPWEAVGRQIVQTVDQWTGLPVGVGFGATKTLAKLANRLAKHRTGVHVLDTTDSVIDALGSIELTDIWGISRGYLHRLNRMGIQTPLQLYRADLSLIRRRLGIVGQRIVYELRGVDCIPLQSIEADRQNICCSRSFGKVTNSLAELHEAIAIFTSQAAMKMRRRGLAANGICVFVRTDRHAPVEQYSAAQKQRLTVPTDDSRLLCQVADECLDKIARYEHKYKRAGVLLMDLCRWSTAQRGLFDPPDPRDPPDAQHGDSAHRLMLTMDRINYLHGRGTIRLGGASAFTLDPCRTWHLRSQHRSPCYTTNWDDLPIIHAA